MPQRTTEEEKRYEMCLLGLSTMVPRKSKSKVSELRPIAMTDVSYKPFMSVTVKGTTEEHLTNNLVKENCFFFSKKGRIENDLMILKYCIGNSFKERETLYVTTVDIAKAYNSVKRDTLIETLKEYRKEKVVCGGQKLAQNTNRAHTGYTVLKVHSFCLTFHFL